MASNYFRLIKTASALAFFWEGDRNNERGSFGKFGEICKTEIFRLKFKPVQKNSKIGPEPVRLPEMLENLNFLIRLARIGSS